MVDHLTVAITMAMVITMVTTTETTAEITAEMAVISTEMMEMVEEDSFEVNNFTDINIKYPKIYDNLNLE